MMSHRREVRRRNPTGAADVLESNISARFWLTPVLISSAGLRVLAANSPVFDRRGVEMAGSAERLERLCSGQPCRPAEGRLA
jgi:hypothetical protein